MSDKVQSASIRIRGLNFDPNIRLVSVDGRQTQLDSRSSLILLALADQFGACVSKDRLLRAGWPTQLVHENSLAKAISKLRRAIEGSGVEIAAIYGMGYSLRDAIELIMDTVPPLQEVAPVGKRRANPAVVTPSMIWMCVVVVAIAIGSFIHAPLGRTLSIRSGTLVTHDAADAVALILWVDDHPSNNSLEVEALKNRRIAVHLAESTVDALKLLAINRYQLVVSDLGRGEDRLAGLRMISTMKQRGMAVPVLIYTARPKDRYGEGTLRQLASDAGAVDLAVTPSEVRASIKKLLAARRYSH